RPFLDHYLKDDEPKMDVAPVNAFETGTNTWRRLNAWPSGCASGCAIAPTPLYLRAGLKASLDPPASGDAPFDEYLSDPAKQVQSSWFPLYDRNPQTFVRNIFFARPEDYRKATQRVYHAPADRGRQSFIELPLVR